MLLTDLLLALPKAQLHGGDTEVKSIQHDSRKVKSGALFVCLKGLKVDGHNFVSEALQKGAVAIVAERITPTNNKPLILVDDTQKALALLCHRFYGEPTKTLILIGVTGTNGKTTTTHLISHLLNSEAGKDVSAVFGTVGVKWKNETYDLDQTTPDAPELVSKLAWLRDNGAKFVVMEVSSHALAHKRSDGCLFDAAVFTNLSQDHLDFHGDFESYFSAKARLFTDYADSALQAGKAFCAFINFDDKWGRTLKNLCPAPVKTFGFNDCPDYRAVDIKLSPSGTQFTLLSPDPHLITTNLVGRFNVANILSSVIVAQHFGVDWETISSALKTFTHPPGRLELIDEGQNFTVAIDYAHTPDALEKVLMTVRELTAGRILVVFGCGGDRDPTKRPKMGRIATQIADYTVITSDNPRTEDPMKIIEQIVNGVDPNAKYHVQPDRRNAIYHAIELAKPNDFILIAGKGHETYQIVGNSKIHFDDRKVAREALSHKLRQI